MQSRLAQSDRAKLWQRTLMVTRVLVSIKNENRI